MNGNEIKEKILRILEDGGETFTKDIAKKASISVTTASKYLSILEAEGQIERRTQKPYTYWKIKSKIKSDG